MMMAMSLPGANAFTLEYRTVGSSTWTERNVTLTAGTGEDARLPLRRAFSYIVTEGEYEVRATLTTVWDTTDSISLWHLHPCILINAHQAQEANFSGRNPLGGKDTRHRANIWPSRNSFSRCKTAHPRVERHGVGR